MGRINTAVYGSKDLWLNGGSYDDDVRIQDKFMQPNFTDAPSTDASASYLKTAIDNGKIKLNKGIDTSPVWSALGTEAPLSHINNYHYYLSDTPDLRTTDDTDAFKWSFGRSLQSDKYALNIKNKEMMFAPSNDYNAIRFRGEYQGVRPMVNTPIKNAVLFPYVFVRAGLSLNDSTRILSLSEYVNPENSYTADYPYITHCFFQVYYNRSTAPVSDTHSRSIWINDAYKCIIEYNSNTVYQDKKISNKTFGKTLQYNNSFCNFAGNSYGITFIGCINSAQSVHGSISSGYEKNQYVIRFTSDMTVSFLNDNANYMIGYIQYYNGFEEYVKRALACFGMFFTTDLQTAQTGQLNDEKMCLGILVDGVGHGDYSTGTGNEEQEQWNWESSEDSDYVPEPDSEFYDIGDIVSDVHDISGGSGGHTIYNMSESNLTLLYKWANSEESGEQGQNYFNYITSVKYVPFGFHKKGNDETVKINGHLVNVDTTAVTGSVGYRLDTIESGSYYFSRWFNDFRDFEPYTRMCIKIPFADTVQLTPSEWYGYSLKVVYTIDEMTGTGTACIYRLNDSTGENLQYISIPCCVAVDVPLTVINSGTYHNALVQAKTQRNSALIGVGVNAINVGSNIATGNGTGIALSSASLISSLESAKQSDYNLTHMTKPVTHFSSASDMSQYRYSYKPNIIITRPVPLPDSFNNSVFTDTIGHACVKTGKLSSFKGFTVVSDVNLSGFNATVEEKQMIESALKGGVIL